MTESDRAADPRGGGGPRAAVEHRPAVEGRRAHRTRAEDVIRLRGSFRVEHSIARAGRRAAVGPGQRQRIRQRAGRPDRRPGRRDGQGRVCKAIYLSGWQVAADANVAGPDLPRPVPLPRQLGAAGRAPHQQRAAARRPDRLGLRRRARAPDWMAPIVADAEAGFGGPLNAFELMKAMIEAGAAGVHFEDQLASEKKCGHLGGKVLVPTDQFIRTLTAARLAADVAGRAHPGGGAHRRAGGDAAHHRHRRARPAVHERRAHARRLLPGARTGSTSRSRAAWPTRRTPT